MPLGFSFPFSPSILIVQICSKPFPSLYKGEVQTWILHIPFPLSYSSKQCLRLEIGVSFTPTIRRYMMVNLCCWFMDTYTFVTTCDWTKSKVCMNQEMSYLHLFVLEWRDLQGLHCTVFITLLFSVYILSSLLGLKMSLSWGLLIFLPSIGNLDENTPMWC